MNNKKILEKQRELLIMVEVLADRKEGQNQKHFLPNDVKGISNY